MGVSGFIHDLVTTTQLFKFSQPLFDKQPLTNNQFDFANFGITELN